jgi:hypothetical protein
MPLTHKQLATGIAYFSLLSQIDSRLRAEEAAQVKSHVKKPAQQGGFLPLNQMQDERTP